ncbi:acid phosphatase [Coniophora puteana RWD-64-598 SS2]|uniref:Phytase A n=1 Tax=Coniophora puteana (strain RWD-64-598) TaxID=741705 RepID=A0A5M3MQQ7_CONPW|nr:acid phosphatase [Coniophora puteana RWD-64-598 SS2]EIW81503.1 acid phosphatase [Coniophora puteana RWD-64-598 SS2]
MQCRFLGVLALTGLATADVVPTAPNIDVPFSITQYWGAYSPYYNAGNYTAPPEGCTVTQVNLLERHGARYPTSGAGPLIQASAEKLKGAQSFNGSQYGFLSNWTYQLGTDVLIPFGAAQSFDAGQVHYTRYASLVNSTTLPFVRASSSERVVETALNWSAGFAFASDKALPSPPPLSVTLDESRNDTLDNHMCPTAPTSQNQTAAWTNVFAPPIADRINNAAHGAHLNSTDIVNLLQLCPFETVAFEKPSNFCSIFTQDDFKGLEYYIDLDDFYSTGYGNPLGPVQGVGWVNELIARLTVQPVQDETQTNSTLDGSPKTFPLNRTFYADFTHDKTMIAIFSALGLFPQTENLSTSHPDAERTWFASRLVPFSAPMIVEKMDCDGTPSIRILVNDLVQPLTFCGARDGMCTVDNFVESQAYARTNGNGAWARCLG